MAAVSQRKNGATLGSYNAPNADTLTRCMLPLLPNYRTI
jgi:hypothetical protein